MQVNQAKDVLVNEIARQANLEGISFSDLERRMLYFTESGDCPEDVFELNAAFEAEYDTEEYEKKITGLAKRAYKRLQKESASGAESWNRALDELKKGDHYILVVSPPTSRREPVPYVVWKTIAFSLLLVIACLILVAVLEHYDFHIVSRSSSRNGIPLSGTYAQTTVWVQRLLLAAMIAGYIYVVVSPLRIKRLVAESFRRIARIFADK